MSQAEVYTSLQQGILDGAENNEFALTIARHGEVARYRLFQHHDAGTAFRYFDVRHRAKMFSSLDSFALLAVPFFVLSGVIMNSGELPPGWSILPNCLLANCPARSLIPTSSAI